MSRIGMVAMPIIGGPRHGDVMRVDLDAYAWVIYEPAPISPWPHPGKTEWATPSRTTYPVRKAIGIMPGRTDRQIVRVLLWPAWAGDHNAPWARDSMIRDGVLCAWAQGWSPRDEDSETWQ